MGDAGAVGRAGDRGLACPAEECGPQLVGEHWEPAAFCQAGCDVIRCRVENAFKGCDGGQGSSYSLREKR